MFLLASSGTLLALCHLPREVLGLLRNLTIDFARISKIRNQAIANYKVGLLHFNLLNLYT